MVLLLFYLIFAILGTQMFKGEFHRCEAKDPEGDYLYPDAMPLTKFALNQTQCTCDGCELHPNPALTLTLTLTPTKPSACATGASSSPHPNPEPSP